jgi:glycerol uptake facilitator-like aquaporin
MGRLLAEMLGTFALIFAGTGAIVTNDVRTETASR